MRRAVANQTPNPSFACPDPHRSSQSPPDSIDSRTDRCLGHRAGMKSIRSWFYAAALLACLLGIVLTTYKPTTNLGAGFSAEGFRPFAAVGSRGAVRHLWLTSPNGTRTQLSQVPVGKKAILQTNSIVVWEESRVIGHGAFDVIYTNLVFAADTTGRRVELSGWLKTRAERVLPTAPIESLPAYVGSDPAPSQPRKDDPRIGVHSFEPISVQLAYWRPGITLWCTVPYLGAYRPLAMEVPEHEIAAYLRQQPLASNQ